MDSVSVALASRRRRGSESASEYERSKSELRRSRVGIRIVKRTTGEEEEDELLLNIAGDEIAMVDLGKSRESDQWGRWSNQS